MHQQHLIYLFILGLSGFIPKTSQAAIGKRYVLIIANNQSLDPKVNSLRYADDDGVSYFNLFRWSSERIALFTVLDEETARLHPEVTSQTLPPAAGHIFATLDRWYKEMRVAARSGISSELLFIYAGHGDVDSSGAGYINLLRKKLFRQDLYRRVIAPCPATYVHLIIDACKSYFVVNRRGEWKDDEASDQRHEMAVQHFLDQETLANYPQVGVILATSGDQETHEWTKYRGGILSYELRSGLAGGADINGDAQVEYSELHAFIAAANARVDHPEAKLSIVAKPPAANRRQPLFDLGQVRNSRLLHFSSAAHGHFVLEDARGVRLADINKPPGLFFNFLLVKGQSYFLYRDQQQAQIKPGDRLVSVDNLSFQPAAIAARTSSLDQSFRRNLFRVPFTRGFYDGFVVQAGDLPVSGTGDEAALLRQEADTAPRKHQLLVGYIGSGALLNLEGLNHGLELQYAYALHPLFSLGAMVEYASSQHSQDGSSSRLHRFAALITASIGWQLHRRIALRGEVNLGYQTYYASDPIDLEGKTVRVVGSDPSGFRLESGVGARLLLSSLLFLDLRGGFGLELVTIDPAERKAHPHPYFAGGLGVTF